MLSRRTILGVALAALAIAPEAAAAQSYPEKPVNLVIPFAAGGSTETMGRIFAKALGDELGQPIVLRVMPGAGGALGATEVAKSDPDGYTLLFVSAAALLWPPMAMDVEFDHDSFDYIAKITDYQQAIVTGADAPFDTFDELVAYSKDHRVSYGDQGALTKVFIDYLGEQAGVDWAGIPTKGGGEMVPFLLGGKIDFAYSGGVHQRYGDEMKVLMSMNAGPLAKTPDAPVVADTYGISMPSQAVLVAPAGTPEDIIATIAAASEKAMDSPEFVDLMNNKLGFPLAYAGTGELNGQMAAAIKSLETVQGEQ